MLHAYRPIRTVFTTIAVALVASLGSVSSFAQGSDVDQIKNNAKAQSEVQAGFTVATTFSAALGPPGAIFGTAINVLENVLKYTGYFGDTDVVGEEIALLQARLATVQQDIEALQTEVNNLAIEQAHDINVAMVYNVAQHHRELMDLLTQLHPTAAGEPTFCRVFKPKPCTTTGNDASPEIAHNVAIAAAGLADDFIDSLESLWIGADLRTDPPLPGTATPVKSVAKGLKPYPALTVYILALQVWITAMEIESAGSHYDAIKQAYGARLARHLAFLQTAAAGGHDKDGVSPPLPDKITSQLRCTWYLGKIGSTDSPQNGVCSANATCQNDIDRRLVFLPDNVSWENPDALCHADLTRVIIPGEEGLDATYGTAAIAAMADVVQRVVATGTARTPFHGTFDTTQRVSVYAVDEHGTVLLFDVPENAPLTQPTSVVGGLSGVKAMLPGGSFWGYAVASDGRLLWYRLSTRGLPAMGPVVVGTGFGAYLHVFGGSDGVIYAIDAAGRLQWWRHTGFSTGGGADTMTGPVTVGSGWQGFKTVFAAGNGVIYAIQPDGTLLWYRHTDFLTGTSRQGLGETVAIAPRAHWEGPLLVGTGWGNFDDVFATETTSTAGTTAGTTILGRKPDGSLLEYQHLDYLTGVSNGGPRVISVVTPRAHWTGPVQVGTGWGQYSAMFGWLPTHVPVQPPN